MLSIFALKFLNLHKKKIPNPFSSINWIILSINLVFSHKIQNKTQTIQDKQLEIT